MKNSLLSLAVLLVLVLNGPASPAKGAAPWLDAAPPPPAGATIYPADADTQVRMMAETVQINVAQNDPGEKPHARVRAIYTMRNLSSKAETVSVRFPLNFLYPGFMTDWEQCNFPLAYPEIDNFVALVDGQAAQVANTTNIISDPGGKRGDVEVACQANFSVVFQPEKDVQIEVRYGAPGYPGVYGNDVYVQFHHVLTSGAGWNGTIGNAEIIVHAPFAFNTKTRLPYSPESGVVSGSEIRWKFTDFEPDSNISVAMMDPAHWQYIQDQVRSVTENPQDGGAWGNLAQAYHQAVKASPEGWRADEGGYELFAKSATAYAKAAGLKPNDVEIHYGYAELLIWNAFYPSFGGPEEVKAGLVRGVDHLRQALKISPDHMRANALLKQLAEWPQAPQPVVDLSGPKPDFLILTPGGEMYTPVATHTRTPFPATLTPEPTWTRVSTRTPTLTATPAPTLTLPALITVVAEQAATPAARGRSPGICGAALAPGMFAVVWAIRRRLVN